MTSPRRIRIRSGRAINVRSFRKSETWKQMVKDDMFFDRITGSRDYKPIFEAINHLADKLARKRLANVSAFLAMPEAGALLSAGVFNEQRMLWVISEAMGASRALLRLEKERSLGLKCKDPKIHAVVIGEGKTPQISVLVAASTRWTVWSVDPELHFDMDKLSQYPWAKRINMVEKTIEACCRNGMFRKAIHASSKVVIVACHSHGSLSAAEKALRHVEQISAVSVPCDCFPQKLTGRDPDVDIEDHGILSDPRKLQIWFKL